MPPLASMRARSLASIGTWSTVSAAASPSLSATMTPHIYHVGAHTYDYEHVAPHIYWYHHTYGGMRTQIEEE
jgi:hypothetical protein